MTIYKKLAIWSMAPFVIWTLAAPLTDAYASVLSKSKKKKTEHTEQVAPVQTGSSAPQPNVPNPSPPQANPLHAPLPLDPNVVHGTLPNGMQYYIRKNAKPENRMEIRLAVNAGSIQEDPDQLGLAHFLEHMAFNGSKHFKKNDLVNYVESIGTKFGPHLNAYTSFDETVYMLQVPTDNPETIDKGLLIVEDWAHGLTLDHEEIEKERGVVVSEWRSSLGPQQRMQNKFLPVLFKDSRYPERLPIGDTAILKTAPYEAFERFYRDWYRPDLMAIIIVGDIDPVQIEKEIKERFSDIKGPENPRKKETYNVPPHKETLVSIVTDKEAPYTQVFVFNKHPSSDPDNLVAYRESLIQQLINNMMNSRFNEILQKPQPPFFAAFSSYGSQLRTLEAFLNVGVGQPDKADEILSTLLEETQRAARYGFTASELSRAIADLTNGYEQALREKDKTESAHYANEYVANYLKKEPSPGIEIENQLVTMLTGTINLNEINVTIKKWATDQNTVIVITGPEKDKDKLPTEEQVMAIRKAVSEKELAPYEDKVVAEALISQPPTAGKIVSTSEDTKHGITTWTLSNGAKVIIKPTTFKNDEILVNAFSAGGSSLYTDADYYTISNADVLVGESGIGNFDKLSLTKALAGKTVGVRPYISELEEGLSGSSSPKDLETLLQLIYLNMTAPRKDADVFQSYIAKQKALFSNLLANPNFYFQKSIYETLYNGHIRRSFPKSEDFDKVNLDKAFQFYNERFSNAGDFTFLFIGNVDMNTLKPLVETYIASLPSTGKKEQWKDPQVTMPKGLVNKEVTMGAAPKTNVYFNYHGDGQWTEQDAFVYDATIGVLNIKMRESMREDQGGVYGVGVKGSFDRIPVQRYNTMITYNADPSKADDLEKVAKSVIQNLISNGTDEATLNKVKETLRRERETDLKENEFWLSSIKESLIFNESLDNLEKFNAKVNALTPDDIKKAAAKYFSGQNVVRVVMSPE